eukprot:8786466-Heterocapsa_arctica.AAC.1
MAECPGDQAADIGQPYLRRWTQGRLRSDWRTYCQHQKRTSDILQTQTERLRARPDDRCRWSVWWGSNR